ncbi:hypothetical protein Tmar_0024 [Thermaerobacter marianensis DSM 12885]|uniref:Uncharacterized protein n=1 Tax=Thermaerobacter marianensis (strain ATCC 700841 / DSM 12885 / JCM 10246 / 7p75a) TaxID=644966 RepID=E6SKG2_THEM7|nr:hypothetical protein [Thermaerobacter marianensis]ADU50149.1 hypothetical protein Tmar_0024 [Thermaerobacter marianensis DSM 12885]
MMVGIGGEGYVRADEVVAILGPMTAEDARQVTPLAFRVDGPDAMVVLRSGQIVPAYLSPQTIRKRVEKALRGQEVARTSAAKVERALLAAYEAMNYMGDILNDMDAVTAKDEAYLNQRFKVVRSVLGEQKLEIREVRLERGQTLFVLYDDPHSDMVREAWITCEDLDRLMDGVPHGAAPQDND